MLSERRGKCECVFVCVCERERKRERSACRNWINNRKTFLCLYPQHPRICIASCSVCVCVCVCVCWKDSCFILFFFVFLSGRSTSFWACRESAQYQQCFVWHKHTHDLLRVQGLAFPGGGGQGVQSKALLQSKCVSGCVCVWDVFFPAWKMARPLPICRETWANRERFLFVLLCLSVPA